MDRQAAQRLGSKIHKDVPDLEYDAALPDRNGSYVTWMYDQYTRRHVRFDSEVQWARRRPFYQEGNDAA